MDTLKNIFATVGFIGMTFILLAIIVAAAPFATIAAINTLFATSIAYNIWTWLSVLWLTAIFGTTKAWVNTKN